jgi:hypothetical protein
MFANPLGTFLEIDELEKYKPNLQVIQLVQTETYNEYELVKTIDKLDKEICGAIAIQLAIVGFGNKTYGSVIVNGNNIDILKFFKSNNFRIDTEINSKLKSHELTPRRLIRFFRYTINDYINENKEVNTYLFKKYCLNKNEKTRKFIFPGFEHIADPVKDVDKIKDLLDTYSFLDNRLETKIKDRIVRVLIARGFHNDVIQQAQISFV